MEGGREGKRERERERERVRERESLITVDKGENRAGGSSLSPLIWRTSEVQERLKPHRKSNNPDLYLQAVSLWVSPEATA